METRAFQDWMVETALPLWAGAGRDAAGGFHEQLTLHGAPDAAASRRVRVQFRQIMVFCAAHSLGLRADGAAIARRAFDRVRKTAWAPDGQPGWIHRISAEGAPLDLSRRAVDQAFALLGLAWLRRPGPDPVIDRAIEETQGFVDAAILAREGGWWEALEEGEDAAAGRRLQYPHMHALEAMLALYESTGERSYLDRAREVYHVFAGRFFDRTANVVLEVFEADWRPAGPRRQRLSPGHMAEWVYLLREFERLSGESVDAVADPLYAKTLAIGLDPSGRFLMDQLTLDGALAKRTRRLWPQTELLKATLCQYRRSGDDALRDRAEHLLADIRAEYLAPATPGGWRDCVDIDHGAVGEAVPASTLYHVFPAFHLCHDLLARRARRPLSRAAGPAAAKAPLERAEAAAAPSITPVVLAGGSGAPLWPLATAATPKQFLRLTGARSLLQETLLRVSDPALFHPPLLVCGAADHAVAAAQAAEVGLSFGTVILEPEARQSAPALAAAALSVAERDPNALLLASPADHAIREAALFPRLVDGAADAARRGSIVAFGVAAARPETRYGYVRVGAPAGVGGAFEIAEFVEKPELERARAMVGSGGYLWNSGIYLCRASDLLDELRRWCAGAVDAARAALDAGARDEPARLGDPTVLRLDAAAFAAAPARSIDVAVMERTERAVVCPAALTWSDVGGWDAIAMAQEGDEAGNIAAGRVTLMDCEGVYARSEGPRIAAIGLRDAVVVATADTVLVTTRDKADQVARIAPRAEECAVAQETTAQETTAQETAARERDARARRDEDQAAAERRDASSEPSARVAAAPSAGGRR